jgi:hypothetical protein
VVSLIKFSKDGKSLAAVTDLLGTPNVSGLAIWKMPSLDTAPTIYPLASDIRPYMVYDPAGKYIAITARNGVQVIDLTTKTAEIWGTMGIARSVAFSPDGQWLAVGFVTLYKVDSAWPFLQTAPIFCTLEMTKRFMRGTLLKVRS